MRGIDQSRPNPTALSVLKSLGGHSRRGRSGMGILLAILVLALPVSSGCGDKPLSKWWYQNKTGLNKAHVQTKRTHDFITRQARYHHVPERHVSEARIGMSKIDSELDNARASELEQEAIRRERIAKVQSDLQNAASREQIKLAEIGQLKKEQSARLTKLRADLSAQTRGLQAQAEKNDRMRDALAKETKTRQDNIISQGEKNFSDANAQIEQLRVEQGEVGREKEATIDEMKETLLAIRTRAEANIESLRVEANSIQEQTEANKLTYASKIKAVPVRIQAEIDQILAQADAIDMDINAVSEELNSHADALEEQQANGNYDLKIAIAKSSRDKAQAGFERSGSEINSDYDQALAEVQKIRADAQMTIEKAHSTYKQQFAELNSWYKHTKAEVVDAILNNASQLEQAARLEFVKAETSARCQAMRETAMHQEDLSEAQMKALTAQAEVEAAQLREKMLEQMREKTFANRVDFNGKTDPADPFPLDIHSLPPVPPVEEVTPRVQPEHVAAYRSALAEVSHELTKADAELRLMDATFGERKSELIAVKSQSLANGNEQFAYADALKEQADALRTERVAAITAKLAVAKTKYSRDLAISEAFRKEFLAKADTLRARARATITHGTAQIRALRKEADVVGDSEQTEIESLQAELNASNEQGMAQTKNLLAQADSLEERTGVQADQIVAQIHTAKRWLVAEMGKFDQMIASNGSIAEADHNEALAVAETVGRKTEVRIKRLEAQDELKFALMQAEIERTRDQLFLERVKGDAEIDRRLAFARAERIEAEAMSDAELIAIRTDAEVVVANATAQRRYAKARERAVKSLFKARVESAIANSVRENINDFLDESFLRTNKRAALARAKASKAETKRKLVALTDERNSLKRAETRNWDRQLAKKRRKGWKSR